MSQRPSRPPRPHPDDRPRPKKGIVERAVEGIVTAWLFVGFLITAPLRWIWSKLEGDGDHDPQRPPDD